MVVLNIILYPYMGGIEGYINCPGLISDESAGLSDADSLSACLSVCLSVCLFVCNSMHSETGSRTGLKLWDMTY